MSTNSHPRFVSANTTRRNPFHKAFKHTFFYILLFCFVNNSYSQWPDSMVVEASDVRFQKAIGKQTLFATAPKYEVADAEIYKLSYKQTPGHYLPHDLPSRLVERDCFLQFALKNSADTAISVCFSPGSYCRLITLFKAQIQDIRGTLTRLPDSLINDDRNNGVKRIRLGPHEEAVFF